MKKLSCLLIAGLLWSGGLLAAKNSMLDYTCPPQLGNTPCSGSWGSLGTDCPNPITNQAGTQFKYYSCVTRGCDTKGIYVLNGGGPGGCIIAHEGYKAHNCNYVRQGGASNELMLYTNDNTDKCP